MAPPLKCSVTTMGRRENPGLITRLMIIDIPMMILSPFQSHTNLMPAFMSSSTERQPPSASGALGG